MRRWLQAYLLHESVEGDRAQRGKFEQGLEALRVALFDLRSDLEQVLRLSPRECVGLPLRHQDVQALWGADGRPALMVSNSADSAGDKCGVSWLLLRARRQA